MNTADVSVARAFENPPITVTFFRNAAARSLTKKELTLDELGQRIRETSDSEKASLPWLKLAVFGNLRSGKESLRHDENVQEISGIELDYDDKRISFDDTIAALRRANLLALLYTSPSHASAAPKWRVLCPTSRRLPPGDRVALVARLNGVLGGIAASESFTLSQSFFYGSVNNNPDHRVEVVHGDHIDLRDDLDDGAIGPARDKGETNGNAFLRAAADQSFKPPLDVKAMLAGMQHGNVHQTQLRVSASLMSAGVEVEDAVAMIVEETKALPDTEHWNWGDEERRLRSMCQDFRRKHPRDANVSLRDALKEREAKPSAVILDPQDPMRSARAMYDAEYRTEDGKDILVRHRGEFFKWGGACYQINAQEAQRQEIWRYLEGARLKTKDDNTAPFRPKKDHVSNVYEALGAVCALDDYIEAPAWIGNERPPAPAGEFFAAANGLLHLPSRTLHAPTSSFFGVTASNVTYDPEAPEPAEWLSFLQQTVSNTQAIEALQEWMGYTLSAETSQQKILFCIGPRRSGKGTFGRIHTALLGKNSVGGPTMTSFGTQFGLAPLITKSLAIVSDARIGRKTDRAAITERLLTISGEDTIDIDRKYGTVWTGRLPTRIAIMTNELPAFSEGSGALAGRFLVIMFQHSFFGREDPGLTDRLTRELPGILNWAIEGYHRLQERGHFVQPANALEQIEAIERLGNPVKAFVQDRCVVGAANEIAADDIYDEYCAWCSDQGADPHNKDWFGRDLRSAVPGLSTARRLVDGRRVMTYLGVGIEGRDHIGVAGHRLTRMTRGGRASS